jgi:hypothetical protein
VRATEGLQAANERIALLACDYGTSAWR